MHPGSAGRIPIGDSSVGAVAVAQAWHGFDASLAVPEVARVLVPGGTLCLVWNVRDHAEPWIAALDQILHQHTRQGIDTRPVIPNLWVPKPASPGQMFCRARRRDLRSSVGRAGPGPSGGGMIFGLWA